MLTSYTVKEAVEAYHALNALASYGMPGEYALKLVRLRRIFKHHFSDFLDTRAAIAKQFGVFENLMDNGSFSMPDELKAPEKEDEKKDLYERCSKFVDELETLGDTEIQTDVELIDINNLIPLLKNPDGAAAIVTPQMVEGLMLLSNND